MRAEDLKPIADAFAPILLAQQRGQLVAAALKGLIIREPGNISTEDEADLAAQAVRLANLVMREAV